MTFEVNGARKHKWEYYIPKETKTMQKNKRGCDKKKSTNDKSKLE